MPHMNSTADAIRECAAKVGLDCQAARQLYADLCHTDDAAGAFAAALVLRAVERYAEADRIIQHAASLVEAQKPKPTQPKP